MAERQQLRLVRSTRQDPTMPSYGTYMLVKPSRSGTGSGVTIMEHATLREIESFLHSSNRGDHEYKAVASNERADAVKGSIVGVYPGAVIDNLENNRRFMVTGDGEFLSCPTRDGNNC
jgi:hypothetical protein